MRSSTTRTWASCIATIARSPSFARPSPEVDVDRRAVVRLSFVSICLAFAEAVLAIPTGLAAGSVALLGFGLDSLIEAGSAATVWWGVSGAGHEGEGRESLSLRVVGALLLVLAAY